MMRPFHHRGARIELVRAVLSGELPLESAAEVAGISHQQLLGWLREHRCTAEPGLDDLRMSSKEQQVRMLRRRVHLLECQLSSVRTAREQILRSLTSGLHAPFAPEHPHLPGMDAPSGVGMSSRSNAADTPSNAFL